MISPSCVRRIRPQPVASGASWSARSSRRLPLRALRSGRPACRRPAGDVAEVTTDDAGRNCPAWTACSAAACPVPSCCSCARPARWLAQLLGQLTDHRADAFAQFLPSTTTRWAGGPSRRHRACEIMLPSAEAVAPWNRRSASALAPGWYPGTATRWWSPDFPSVRFVRATPFTPYETAQSGKFCFQPIRVRSSRSVARQELAPSPGIEPEPSEPKSEVRCRYTTTDWLKCPPETLVPLSGGIMHSRGSTEKERSPRRAG